MHSNEYMPGEPAPHEGRYEELNVLGARTGKVVEVTELQPFPEAPRGFTWRLNAAPTEGTARTASRPRRHLPLH
jgi:hypothetical protein